MYACSQLQGSNQNNQFAKQASIQTSLQTDTNGVGVAFICIAAGSFYAGAGKNLKDAYSN
jgi:hypothetical protein